MVKRPAKWLRLLTLLMLASIFACQACAYEVALKDGRVLHFKKCHVTDGILYYTDDTGRENTIGLDAINLDLTRQLNKNENPPLELSGSLQNQDKKGPTEEQSLGEVARQVRGNRPTTTQRTFTNDDVKSATEDDWLQDWIKAGASTHSPDPAQRRRILEKALVFAKTGQHLTEQEVASFALGKLDEIQFPGRDRWQAQLYAAHQKVYTLLETCVERTDEENHIACSKVESAQAQLGTLKQEGIKRATQWKEDREK